MTKLKQVPVSVKLNEITVKSNAQLINMEALISGQITDGAAD